MSKLQLPDVTLFCVDSIDPNRAIRVLERCKSFCDFGDVKFLTHEPLDYPHRVAIKPIQSLISYSIFMLTKAHEYINTKHFLIVQRDGWILNPSAWKDEWLNYDFIGPLFMQYDKVGSGGFSLRSKKIMGYIASGMPKWNWTKDHADKIQSKLNYYEDGIVCFSGLQEYFKFPSCEQAADFAQGGNRNPEYLRERPFGFHRTWQQIDFTTGLVDSRDKSKDIHISYDAEIDAL